MRERIQAAVMVAPQPPIEIRELSAPDLPVGSALLRTLRSDVCGTDLPLPISPGHVPAALIEPWAAA